MLLCPRRRSALLSVALSACSLALLVPSASQARITRIDAKVVESPTFGGRTFGPVGQYEKLRGTAFGEVDPRDPHNAVIADIQNAPRNARGMVEYSTDIWLVRPIDRSRANRRLFFELNNRGDNRSFEALNDATTGGNDPTTAEDAGNGFLMNQGYTILEAGWDATVAPGEDRFQISVPTARNADGSSIVGPSLEEFVIDEATTDAQPVTYANAAGASQDGAELTYRLRYDDPPQPLPASAWAFSPDGKSVTLQPSGTPFAVGLYELTYQAKDPLVAGLGFAAVRDLASFLRGRRDIDAVDSFGVSQPSRTMNDFLHLGFNQDEDGRQVFDGVLNWIGGASGVFINQRFAQPFRTHRQHIGRCPRVRVPVRQPGADGPVHRPDRRPPAPLRADAHVPAHPRGQLGERVLGQGGVGAPPPTPGPRPRRRAGRALLPAVEPAPRRRRGTGHLPAAAQPAAAEHGPARDARRSRRLDERRRSPPRVAPAAPRRRDARAGRGRRPTSASRASRA